MQGFVKFLLGLATILVVLSFIGVEPLATYKESFFESSRIEAPEGETKTPSQPTELSEERGETSSPKETSEEPSQKATLEIPVAHQIHNLVNAERQKREISPVKWSEQLAKMAQSQAEHCAEIGDLVHSSRYAFEGGENLFWSFGTPDAQAVVDCWMESTQGHREYLLSPRVKYAGIGITFGSRGTFAAWAFADMALFTEFGN